MIEIVYFDMDGVLADLAHAVHAYAQEHYGISTSKEEMVKTPKAIHHFYILRRKDVGMFDSFRSLPTNRLDEMRAAMTRLHKAGIAVEILTSYGVRDAIEMGSEVHRGKAAFMLKHFGDLFDSGVIRQFNGVSKSSQKAFYASPKSILIDDWSKNINAWRATGSPAVHYHMDRHYDGMRELYQLTGLEEEQWG